MNPASFIFPAWDAPANIGALATTRMGGVSMGVYGDGSGGGGLNLAGHVGDLVDDVETNRLLLDGMLPAPPVWLSQVHGTTVVNAADAVAGQPADAIIATRPDLVCAVQTADCLPILLADRSGKAVGAAHGGWRGLAGGIVENTVLGMRAEGAADIVAWLGPAIGPSAFEVGDDVRQAFCRIDDAMARAFLPIDMRPGKFLADIYELARMLLRAVDVHSIVGGGFCTVSDPRFYSFRRDRITGRMASLIWIKSPEH